MMKDQGSFNVTFHTVQFVGVETGHNGHGIRNFKASLEQVTVSSHGIVMGYNAVRHH